MAESTGFTRRHFLTVATLVTGGAGVVATAVPFVSSFNPSARAQALGGPVQFDISKLERGALAKVEWRGRPIYIVHRTDEMLASLGKDEAMLRDPSSKESVQPSYATNEYRSLRKEFLVLEGVCTHLGCAPLPRFEVAPADLGPQLAGRFLLPLPRFSIRSGRARVPGRSRTVESAGAGVPLRQRQHDPDRFRHGEFINGERG